MNLSGRTEILLRYLTHVWHISGMPFVHVLANFSYSSNDNVCFSWLDKFFF